MKKIELLAPAGDFEKMKWAFWYGADAVYIGGYHFGLRANAANFSKSELKKSIIYAHKLNKKIYVTVNIVLHNQEIKKIEKYLMDLEKMKADAIIVSDLYVLKLAKKITNLEVHISTQASVFNYQAALVLEKMGASRIILARELEKKDIALIIEKTNIEMETFIHGAMCAGVSGRCVLSNVLTNRDANRGGCSQICRWHFSLFWKKAKTSDYFSLSTKDLIMANHIKELIKIGVKSLKIEGRMRSIYYIATVVSIYRRIIDGFFENKDYQISKKDLFDLKRVANRELIAQFFEKGSQKEYQYYGQREENTNQDFLGIILSYNQKNNLALIEQRNYFEEGEMVEYFSPNKNGGCFKIEEIFDEKMNKIKVVRHPKQKVYIKTNHILEKNGIIRKNNLTKKRN